MTRTEQTEPEHPRASENIESDDSERQVRRTLMLLHLHTARAAAARKRDRPSRLIPASRQSE